MINTIIFDWGGVLIKGTHTGGVIRIIEERFGLKDTFSLIDSQMVILDSGESNLEEFTETINKEYSITIPLDEMNSIFEEAIVPDDEMMDLVKRLKKKYKLILLSNNNHPTIKILRQKYQQMLALFEKVYLSAELKIRKPDKKLFDYVINDLGLKPEECLFIDDKEKNIKGSEAAGMKGILFENISQFRKELSSYNINPD